MSPLSLIFGYWVAKRLSSPCSHRCRVPEILSSHAHGKSSKADHGIKDHSLTYGQFILVGYSKCTQFAVLLIYGNGGS